MSEGKRTLWTFYFGWTLFRFAVKAFSVPQQQGETKALVVFANRVRLLIERRFRSRISLGNMVVPQNVDALYKTMANAYSVGENQCLVLYMFLYTNSSKYTAVDKLFNPIYEDNYPTVNLEAEA